MANSPFLLFRERLYQEVLRKNTRESFCSLGRFVVVIYGMRMMSKHFFLLFSLNQGGRIGGRGKGWPKPLPNLEQQKHARCFAPVVLDCFCPLPLSPARHAGRSHCIPVVPETTSSQLKKPFKPPRLRSCWKERKRKLFHRSELRGKRFWKHRKWCHTCTNYDVIFTHQWRHMVSGNVFLSPQGK